MQSSEIHAADESRFHVEALKDRLRDESIAEIHETLHRLKESLDHLHEKEKSISIVKD